MSVDITIAISHMNIQLQPICELINHVADCYYNVHRPKCLVGKKTFILKCMIFGPFGLSTKEHYTIMLCPSSLAFASSSVHTSLCHGVSRRNFIFSLHMNICLPYMHITYLVILTCSFLNGSHFGTFHLLSRSYRQL